MKKPININVINESNSFVFCLLNDLDKDTYDGVGVIHQ